LEGAGEEKGVKAVLELKRDEISRICPLDAFSVLWPCDVDPNQTMNPPTPETDLTKNKAISTPKSTPLDGSWQKENLTTVRFELTHLSIMQIYPIGWSKEKSLSASP
jgi:hypothetical protein